MKWKLLPLLLLPVYAAAAVTTVVTPGLYDLYQGSKKIKSGLPSNDACIKAAELLDVTQTYSCRVSNKVVTTKVPPVPPRPADAIAIEGENFTLQIRSTVMYGFGTNWASKVLIASTYTCDNAQFGDPYVGKPKYCKLGPPPPDLPPDNKPPDMHAGIFLDPATIPVFPPGINYPLLSDPMPLPPGPAPGDWEKDGKWRFVCNGTKITWDDPIVYPGQPGKSHPHLFFGNVAIDAYTTVDNIFQPNGYASCRGGNINQSGYWVPAMIDTEKGVVVKPKANLGYYATGFWRYMNDGSVLQPFPKGLRMIAGTPTATGPGGYHGGMQCLWKAMGYSRPGTQTDGALPINCVSGEDELWQVLVFPQCWDGVNLDSPDHKSHMAYPEFNSSSTWTAERQYRCPVSHPVVVPELSYHVQYEIPDATRLKWWKLSSDVYEGRAGYSWHGDYMYGWDQKIADEWMIFCLRGQRNCGTANLADGRVTLEFQGN